MHAVLERQQVAAVHGDEQGREGDFAPPRRGQLHLPSTLCSDATTGPRLRALH
jgi:hypothetical protein